MEGIDRKKVKFALCASAAQVAAYNGFFSFFVTMRDTRIARVNFALIKKLAFVFNLHLYTEFLIKPDIFRFKDCKLSRFMIK